MAYRVEKKVYTYHEINNNMSLKSTFRSMGRCFPYLTEKAHQEKGIWFWHNSDINQEKFNWS